MKHTNILLIGLMIISVMIISSCEREQSSSTDRPQFESINSPEAKAYLHNATIKSILSIQTRADNDEYTDLPEDYIALTCEVLEAQASELGFEVSLTDENVENIHDYVDDFNLRISNSLRGTILYYI